MSKNHVNVDIFIGVEVGASNPHTGAIDRKGSKPLDRTLSKDEAKLGVIIQAVAGKSASLLVMDQPLTIEALPVAVAAAEGVLVDYMPGLTMRRIADLHSRRGQDRRRCSTIMGAT